MKIVLRVPGAEVRHGEFVCDLPFDNFCKVHITAYEEKGKIKLLNPSQHYWYLAHKENVEEVNGKANENNQGNP